jgi:REP element-mobilizing transposase RayT
MRKLEGFCCLEILTYSIMDNHFHILVKEPERRKISDKELIYRLGLLYDSFEVDRIRKEMAGMRKEGRHAAAEALKQRYVYRMFNISEFFKTLKQGFGQYYNRKHGRKGTLWEGRFKSLLVEGSGNALSTISAYIDLNAVRVGLVQDPKDYRYCGYAEAVAGDCAARKGLSLVMQSLCSDHRWKQIGPEYRKLMYVQGGHKGLSPDGKPLSGCFTKEKVQKILDQGGSLPMQEALRCRVRYFSDGLVLGSKQFVEDMFTEYRDQFGSKRPNGARPMKYGQWDGLCTLRALRLNPVSLQ